jgi:hypothetical protein
VPEGAQQLSAFDVPAGKHGRFNVYHDESDTDSYHDRFQLHGALLVPAGEAHWARALAALNSARRGYDGRIHFVELRDNARNPKSAIAAEWVRLYFGELCGYCFYKCMIADTHAPGYSTSRFAQQPYQLYNRTATLAVFSGLVWSLKGYDEVTLELFSERITRPEDDPFEAYLASELPRRARLRKPGACPRVRVPAGRVRLVEGDPRKAPEAMKGHCEFIQLTDLLTGAVAQALNAPATQRVKIDLGQMAAGWIEDSRRPPWHQQHDLHRRFSVSCYPDAKGGFYDVKLAIEEKGQLRLF